jgi:hypothetical protein
LLLFNQVGHIVIVLHVDRVRLCLLTAATNGPIVHPPGGVWTWRVMEEWYWRGKPKHCSSATLSTTNHTWTCPGVNSGLCCERSATNRLIHGTAGTYNYYWALKGQGNIIFLLDLIFMVTYTVYVVGMTTVPWFQMFKNGGRSLLLTSSEIKNILTRRFTTLERDISCLAGTGLNLYTVGGDWQDK